MQNSLMCNDIGNRIGNSDSSYDAECASKEYVGFAIAQLFLCFLGLLVIMVTIMITWKMKKRCKLFDHLLICLLVFDGIVLLTAPIFLFGLKHKYFQCDACAYLVQYWCFPVGHMGTFGTVLMTLAISHERYLAIREPVHYNRSLAGEQKQRKRLLIYLIPTIILSIASNIPRFYTFSTEHNNATDSIELKLDWGCDKNYLLYYTFLYNTVPFGFVPFTLLIFLGYKTLQRLRYHQTQFRRSALQGDEEDRLKGQEEEQMAKVMIGIVIVFLVNHFLRIFLNTVDGIQQQRYTRCTGNGKYVGKEDKYLAIVIVSIFMEILNSIIDPLIYAVMSTEFRKELLKTLGRKQS